MRSSLCVVLGLALTVSVSAQQGASTAPSQPAPATAQSQLDKAGQALQHGDFKTTLALARDVIAASPDNIVAYNLAGNAALRLHDYTAAIDYFRQALQLQPDEYHNVAGLMGAYNLARMSAEAATEREHIRQLKLAGRLPRDFSFLLDRFDAGDKNVLVVEFFPDLGGRFHHRYSFNVTDASGKQAYSVRLESDDVDQEYFRKEHPKEAAGGGRAFSLDGYGSGSHATIKYYDGEPTYATAREDATQYLLGKLQAISQTTRDTAPAPAVPPSPPKP